MDRVRTANQQYNPHLGNGNRRGDSSYRPKFTHEELDAIVDGLTRGDDPDYDIGVIDMGDGAVLTGYSKSYRPLRDATLDRIVGSLEAVGTGDIVADVVVNGAAVTTITLPAGETTAELDLSQFFSADDRWQMNVTTTSTDANGLTWYGRFT